MWEGVRGLLSRLVIATFLCFIAAQGCAERLAFVVGIDRYDHLEDLNKARNDATALAAALEELAFDVTIVLDASERQLNRELASFLDRIEAGDEVVFFFAGHGIELDGRNYLLPSDVPDVASERVIRTASLDADELLQDIQDAGALAAVMILDACRDNPLTSDGRSFGGARGLTISAAPEGSFILMSAASGQIAYEGEDDDPNSIFTRVLLEIIQEPGLSLPELATRVRRDVQVAARRLGYDQRPAYVDEGARDFVFAAVDAGVEPPSQQPESPSECELARQDWYIIGDAYDAAILDAFLSAHGDCDLYAAIANRARLDLNGSEEYQLARIAELEAQLTASLDQLLAEQTARAGAEYSAETALTLLEAMDFANTAAASTLETLEIELARILTTDILAEAGGLVAGVQELARYRSEFLGVLREVLEGRDDVRIEDPHFVFDSEVLFEVGSADLSPEGEAQIANVAELLFEVAGEIPISVDWIVRVDGHADAQEVLSTEHYSDAWELSQARALSVVLFMSEELGFPPARLAATGFGAYRPIASNETEDGRTQNRRIELTLTGR